MSEAVPVAILAGLVLLAFAGMWAGWKRRGSKHHLDPLPPPDDQPAELAGSGRYFGTTVAGDWLDRVVASGLGARSDCTLTFGQAGLDVRRPRSSSFRIGRDALVDARRGPGIAGKVIPPDGMLLVTWRHGDHTLDSGFRLEAGDHDRWVAAIQALAKKEHA